MRVQCSRRWTCYCMENDRVRTFRGICEEVNGRAEGAPVSFVENNMLYFPIKHLSRQVRVVRHL